MSKKKARPRGAELSTVTIPPKSLRANFKPENRLSMAAKWRLSSHLLVLRGERSRLRTILVMGFPPRHRFPPNGTRSPGVPPVAGASLYL